MAATFRIAASADDRRRAFAIRRAVFCDEQQVPWEIEIDEFEDTAIHIIGDFRGLTVAVARLRLLPDHAKLERIAVSKPYRGNGIGTELIEFMMETARENGYSHFRMHAQAQLQSYYERLGFRVDGEPFIEAGIDHVPMTRVDRRTA